MSRLFLLPLSVVFMAAAVLLGGVVPIGAQDGAGEEPGKRIIRQHCMKCHDLRRVKTRIGKLDAEEWTEIINEMVHKGAKLTPDEKGEAVRFLASQSSPEALN